MKEATRVTRGKKLSRVLGLACWVALGQHFGCATSDVGTTAETAQAEEAPDLFPDLSAELERQMREQREAALAKGREIKAQEIDPFAADALEDRMQELQIKTFGGCVRSEEDFQDLGSMVGYRLLRASDYQGREAAPKPGSATLQVRNRAPISPVVHVGCILVTASSPTATGGFIATIESLEFVELFDRQASWWNPEQAGNDSTRLHGQLHFDLAHLLAKEANRRSVVHKKGLRGIGPTQRTALDDLALRLNSEVGKIEKDLRRLERQFDLESSHGWGEASTRIWEDRVRHGLGAVRAALPPEDAVR